MNDIPEIETELFLKILETCSTFSLIINYETSFCLLISSKLHLVFRKDDIYEVPIENTI